MRDPKRIDDFTKQLAEAWKKLPDWRFGQMISNFESWYGRDIFFLEEDRFAELLEQFIGGLTE